MKRVLLLLILLLSLIGYAQDVKKYKAFEAYYYENEAKRELAADEELKWEEANILVVVNIDKDNIRIFSKTEQQFDVIAKGKTKVNVKGNKTYTYTAVDSNGIKCSVDFILFKDPQTQHIATLIVTYKDYTFAYRLKDI